MLNRQEVEDAVETHRACYALLEWLGSALDRTFVSPKAAHGYLSDAQAAAEWIVEHFDNLPARCRPASRSGPQLESFATYFSSYLVASFEFQQAPGPQLVSNHGGCYCRMCSYIGRAPYLKPKRLAAEDRRRAERLKSTCLEELAAHEGLPHDSAVVSRVLRQHGDDVALVAYGQELLRRCRGRATGPAALALWRRLAWRGGSRRQDFELRADAILEAEQRLRVALEAGQTKRAAERGDEGDRCSAELAESDVAPPTRRPTGVAIVLLSALAALAGCASRNPKPTTVILEADATIPPQLVRQGRLEIPPELNRRSCTSGTTVVEVQVGATGRAQDAHVQRASQEPAFDAACVRSAKASEYRPATSRGTPTVGTTKIECKLACP